MKKNENILNRLRKVEQKYGISYARPDGKLFVTLKVIFTLVFIYTMGINLLYIASVLLRYSNTDNLKYYLNSLYTVSISTGGILIGFILLCTKLKIVGTAVSIIPIPFLVFNFANATEDSLGFFGYKAIFYWRHFIPLVLMFVLSVWMLIIALRFEIKTNKSYNKLCENLYTTYHIAIADKNSSDVITDEMWTDFMDNYDPSYYKTQYNKKTKSVEKELNNTDENSDL